MSRRGRHSARASKSSSSVGNAFMNGSNSVWNSKDVPGINSPISPASLQVSIGSQEDECGLTPKVLCKRMILKDRLCHDMGGGRQGNGAIRG